MILFPTGTDLAFLAKRKGYLSYSIVLGFRPNKLKGKGLIHPSYPVLLREVNWKH